MLTITRAKANRSEKHVNATSHLASIATTTRAKNSTTIGGARSFVEPFPVYKSRQREAGNKKQCAFCILNWTIQRMKFLNR